MIRRILLALLLLLALALAVNTIFEDNETKGAKADVGRLVKVDDRTIQLREDGPRGAPPIVLIHCFSCSLHWWDRITPLLARNHRVIRMDLLGHGGSEKPGSGYRMQDQARLVGALLDRLHVRRATIVGHSMGVNVATALAEQSPALVAKIVAIDQSPSSKEQKTDLLIDLSGTPVIGEAMKRTAPDSTIRDGMSKAFAKGVKVPDQFVEGLKGMTYTAYADSLNKAGDYRDEKSLDKRLATTHKPLLVIFGAEDQLEKRSAFEAYRDVPGARLVLVGGAGHSPAYEKPAQTARLIQRFARR